MASVVSSDSSTEATNEPANAGAPEAHVSAATSVCAPRMEQRYYASWEEFFSALSEYQDATCQVFGKRSSTSVAARNAELERQGTLSVTTAIPLALKSTNVGSAARIIGVFETTCNVRSNVRRGSPTDVARLEVIRR
ncbi:hypothetical protein PF002_g13356 [Phytophthora fragariae]|uniref:Uncharacterized protein n=1 Tax=Phytophthora fragariae TaxID=53985 RepID=A0A6A3QRB0_9STRA|nr:hypothetical protein PF009_g14355 [Phytophthora fragariae]KAE9081702.1 hypothetical protein PF007_g22556 [Phytophthora fragariae]KAE9229244.1 hypothetical protein PF002_g13356 [Phytophthora fragariae]